MDDFISLRQAQQIFTQWLEQQTVVYGKDSLHGFDVKASPTDTYAAYLVSPTELAAEKCEHQSVMPLGIEAVNSNREHKCFRCGVKLRAEWKEVSE